LFRPLPTINDFICKVHAVGLANKNGTLCT
jgi:hypothetical protein